MTRTFKVLISGTVLLLLVLVFVGSTQASAEPQVVRVTLTDYQVQLSQFTVLPGKTVQFLVTNDGVLSHRFAVQPFAGAETADSGQLPVVAPGSTMTFVRTFGPGVYQVICTEWDHAERGMVSVFAADKQRSPAFPLRMDLWIPLFSLVAGAAWIIGDNMGLRLTRAK